MYDLSQHRISPAQFFNQPRQLQGLILLSSIAESFRPDRPQLPFLQDDQAFFTCLRLACSIESRAGSLAESDLNAAYRPRETLEDFAS